MTIRRSTESDWPEIGSVHLKAFGMDKGPEITELVNGLLDDETANPLLSLVAEKDGRLIGHILFTRANIQPEDHTVSVQLLAPLAVVPEYQSEGVGGQLIREGLKQLKDSGVDLVFVLGHPGYYPRLGFQTAGEVGFEAPYPIPEGDADAWMVQELREGVIASVEGRVQCARVLDQPQHWRE